MVENALNSDIWSRITFKSMHIIYNLFKKLTEMMAVYDVCSIILILRVIWYCLKGDRCDESVT